MVPAGSGEGPKPSIHRCVHPDVDEFFVKNPNAECPGHTAKIVPAINFDAEKIIFIRKT